MDKYLPLQTFMDESGKIQQFPGKRRKKIVTLMLEYLSEKFEKGTTYTEIEVNEILNTYHSFNDPAILRRLLFGKKLLNRTLDGRAYWVDG